MHTFTLPTGLEAELREMTGAEEEILTNPRLIRSGDAINQVLANCVVRLGELKSPSVKDVLDLLSGDRLFLLVRLRQVSLGDEVTLELACTNATCRHVNAIRVGLDELEVTPYGPEREFNTTLPGSGHTVTFVHLDGHMEKRLAALKEPSISSAMTIRIREIDGKARLDWGLRIEDCGTIRPKKSEIPNPTSEIRLEPAFLFPGVRF